MVIGRGFAGTELYVCEIARACAERGHRLTVVGGDPVRMTASLGPAVRWLAGSSLAQGAHSLFSVGRIDVVHAHMTSSETAALSLRWRNRGLFVCTRHFAGQRGSSLPARALSPLINAALDRQIAISGFVAEHLEIVPDVVLRHGARSQRQHGTPSTHRRVLVLQRLEPEKDTATALHAWQHSGLGQRGWHLRIAGQGQQRHELELLAARLGIEPSVEFLGFVNNAREELRQADIVVATALAEPFGLSVLEAMSVGTAVVATSAGGHLETVGLASDAQLYSAGDVVGLSEALVRLAADEPRRHAYANELQALQRAQFDLDRHVDRLLEVYQS